MNEQAWIALLLSTLAGLSTGIGSVVALVSHHGNKRLLASALGFSAGVMIYIAFVEMFPEARELLRSAHSESTGDAIAVVSFFAGVLLILAIDRVVSDADNPHVAYLPEETAELRDTARLRRVGVLTALAIGIHNLPEGLATFFAAYEDTRIGIAIAIAVALHNIPEGISVAVPIYAATGSRKKAFWFSFLSGVAEPIGALLAFTLLRPWLGPPLLGVVLAGVAGVMVFLAVDILVPNAKKYDVRHDSVYGLLAGMLVMAVTLLLV